MDQLTKYILEQNLSEKALNNLVQKSAEKKLPGFRQNFKEAMKFVNQNWFVIKDAIGPLYGVAIAIIAAGSGQPVSKIAKQLKQK